MNVLRRMKGLNTVHVSYGPGILSVKEFWKRYEAGEFAK
jgi:hypothetical protein